MATDKAVAVARFNEPSVLSVQRRPEHEIQSKFGTETPGVPLEWLTPLGSGADHELNLVRQGERLFEQEISAPLGMTAAEQRRQRLNLSRSRIGWKSK